MASVATSAAGAVSTGVDGLLFSGAGSILITLAKLAAELYTSREMCEDLISSVAGLQAPLANMLASGHATITRSVLTQYNDLLLEIELFLKDHIRSGRVARVTKHWSMKKRIKDFHVERARIEAILNLAFMGESAEKHVQLTSMVEGMAKTNERIEQQHVQYLAGLQQRIDDISSITSLADTRLVLVALADLKHEIKSKASEYSESELKLMKQLFLAGCKSYKIPRDDLSLPVWYIPRSDVRFDRANPFATGEFHSLHYGTLDSGARVAVNIVNAEPEDTKVRERFVREVDSLNLLRNPHILPFFGANHKDAPLMYVTAIASNGDFRSYLRSHRDRFWKLFLDVARGLAYLHNHKVVHGNLKCSNLLVLADGTGVVSDFMFAFVRASSELSLKTRPTTYEWTAPECLGVGKDANPRFESDVYSLGMCVIEAATGQRPFHGVTDNDEAIRDRIRDGRFPDWTSPDGDKISPEVTALVTTMCAREYTHRAKLDQIIHTLAMLAAQELAAQELAAQELAA